MRSLGAARGRYEAAPLALSRRFSLAPTAPFSFSLGQRHRGAEADISPSSAAICAVAAASPPPGPGPSGVGTRPLQRAIGRLAGARREHR